MIHAISRTVGDLARAEAFYRDGLGFSTLAPPEPVPPPILEAIGLPDTAATRLRMGIGAQTVEFLAFDPPGHPYPADPLATDPFFQHVAIPVRDMEAAMERLAAVDSRPVSTGGAQKLPESSGGVTAFKARDPDGHPFELIVFPDGPAAARWAQAPGLFLGIDHSAITVTDLDAALTFFTGALGFSLTQRGVNRGPEQARLDGLPDPEVDVVALVLPGQGTPHLELLHRRRPETTWPTPTPFCPRDRATTRLVLASRDVAAAVRAVEAAGYRATVSRDGITAYAAGPDGHGMLLVRQIG